MMWSLTGLVVAHIVVYVIGELPSCRGRIAGLRLNHVERLVLESCPSGVAR